jgi:hypothetical protein
MKKMIWVGFIFSMILLAGCRNNHQFTDTSSGKMTTFEITEEKRHERSVEYCQTLKDGDVEFRNFGEERVVVLMDIRLGKDLTYDFRCDDNKIQLYHIKTNRR